MLYLLRAQLEDAVSITKIKTEAYNKEINTYLGRDGGPKGYNEVASEEAIIKHFLAYKIMLDEALIGAFFLVPEGEERMRLEDFVIIPKMQNKGYGFETLQRIEALYPHIKTWSLSTPVFSIGNQHLYEKAGYQRVGQNEDEIEYKKDIQ